MYFCEECGTAISDESKVIWQTNRSTGEKTTICHNCFERFSGTTFDKYSERKTKSQLGCAYIFLGLFGSLLLFYFYGFWYGAGSLVATYFLCKAVSGK